MKDLKFSKEKIALLKDKDLTGVIGGAGPGIVELPDSCNRKSCDDAPPEEEIDEI